MKVADVAVRTALLDAVPRLPDRERVGVGLHSFDGMTFAAIGRLIDVT